MRLPTMALALCVTACSGDGPQTPSPSQARSDPSADREASGRYQLRFAGVPVGITDLSVRHRDGGYRFRRDDSIAVHRDGERVESTTSIIVDTDPEFRAREVVVRSHVGGMASKARAVRDAGGWVIRNALGAMRRRSGIEIAELAVLSPRVEHSGEPMLMAGANFAMLEIDAERRAGGDFRLRLSSEVGRSTIQVSLADDGLPRRWGSDSGESAIRTDGLAPPIYAAELLELASIPSVGRRSSAVHVVSTNRIPPPSLAGQVSEATARGFRVQFSRARTKVPQKLVALVVGVDQRIEDDLTLPGLSGSEALRMGRGDCSGHASALAVLARELGYEAMLATGYRRRGGAWMRHRWTVVKLASGWVSLDPSFGEARPGLARLMILAVHEPTPEAMALADLLTFSGLAGARAEFE